MSDPISAALDLTNTILRRGQNSNRSETEPILELLERQSVFLDLVAKQRDTLGEVRVVQE